MGRIRMTMRDCSPWDDSEKSDMPRFCINKFVDDETTIFTIRKSKFAKIVSLCWYVKTVVCTLYGGPILTVLKVSLPFDHSKYAFWTESGLGALWDPRGENDVMDLLSERFCTFIISSCVRVSMMMRRLRASTATGAAPQKEVSRFAPQCLAGSSSI